MIWLIRIPVCILMFIGGLYAVNYAFFDGEGFKEAEEDRALRLMMKRGTLYDIPEEKEN